MTFDDCLGPASIRVGLDVAAFDEVLRTLLAAPGLANGDPESRVRQARNLAFGTQGEVVRLHDDVVLVLAVDDGVDEPVAALATTRARFEVTGEGSEDVRSARVVVLFLLPGRLSAFRGQAAPVLGRWMRESDHAAQLVAASSPEEVRALPGLGELVLSTRLRVDSVSIAAPHRVGPDASMARVLDLMVRESLHALPVVGDADELLGIITAGDVLRHLLPSRRVDGEGAAALEVQGRAAREVMTRSVLCVSEDQALTDAAVMMVNREVDELPVVREGALVGLLTKESVLRALHEG